MSDPVHIVTDTDRRRWSAAATDRYRGGQLDLAKRLIDAAWCYPGWIPVSERDAIETEIGASQGTHAG